MACGIPEEPRFGVEQGQRLAVTPESAEDSPRAAKGRQVVRQPRASSDIMLAGLFRVVERKLEGAPHFVVEPCRTSRFGLERELGFTRRDQLIRECRPRRLAAGRFLGERRAESATLAEQSSRIGVGLGRLFGKGGHLRRKYRRGSWRGHGYGR